jgi:hypothetical protein
VALVFPGQPATPTIGTRKGALTTGVAQAVGGALLWHFRPGAAASVLRIVASAAACLLWVQASAFVLSALVAPAIAIRLQSGWMRVARAIGIVITVAMFTVLFAVFLPFFLFVRLRDPLRKKLGARSYWETRVPEDDSLDRALRPY